jgi:hypothetical protein
MSQINETQNDQLPSIIETPKRQSPEAMPKRWAALVGAFVLGVLYALLPDYVSIGGLSWLPLVLVSVILVPVILIAFVGRHRQVSVPLVTIRILLFIMLGVLTLTLAIGVGLMIETLPTRTPAQSVGLLRTAALLWTSNILVFGLWYWEIDGGGPHKRFMAGHPAADFMFPQQVDGNTTGWAPHFFDYLFVAFTGATAFSPTDTYPLTWKAKALMMIEATISLVIGVILVGRAINILGK